MNKVAVINLKTDPKLKKEAQELADTLGISLSQVLNAALRRFTVARQFTVTEDFIPTDELIADIRQAQRENAGGVMTDVTTKGELRRHLASLRSS